MKLRFLSLLLFSTTVLADTKLSPQQIAENIKQFHKLKPWRPSTKPLSNMKLAYALENAAQREWSLYQILENTNPATINKETLQWLQHLSVYKSQTKSWLNDGGHKIEITPWPIAAQAKGIIARWEVLQSKNMAIAKLSEANWRSLLDVEKKTKRLGIFKAISEASIDELTPLAKAIYIKNKPSEFELQLLWNISQKTDSMDWMKKVIRQANKSLASPLMKQNLNTAKLNKSSQLELFKEALNNPHLASFALLKLSLFVNENKHVQTLLLNYLEDKHLGGSAARALSQSNSAHLKQKLQLLSKSENTLLSKRALQVINWQKQLQQGGQ